MHTEIESYSESEETAVATRPLAPAPAPPKRIAGYELLALLGQGAMGSVFLCRNHATQQTGALKLVALHDEMQQARFRRSIAARLEVEHPALLPLWAYGQEEQHGFLVSPLLQPTTLGARVGCETLSFDEAADILGPIAGALDALHRNDWVHRDVKPDNILLEEGNQPYLVDFGLAKHHLNRLEDSGAIPLTEDEETMPNSLCGTPIFMSGQRLQNQPARPSDDVFALALCMVELLTGQVPGGGARASYFSLADQRIDRRLNLPPLPCPSAVEKALQAAVSPRSRHRPSAGDIESLLS